MPRKKESLTNQGDFDKSKERVNEGLSLLKGEESIESARLLSVLGWTCLRTSNYPQALFYFEKALPITERCKDKKEMANVMHNIGSIYLHTGENGNATEYLGKAYKLREEMNDLKSISSSLISFIISDSSFKQLTN